jgi:plasmid maintenance system antidote protein VapI
MDIDQNSQQWKNMQDAIDLRSQVRKYVSNIFNLNKT